MKLLTRIDKGLFAPFAGTQEGLEIGINSSSLGHRITCVPIKL